MDRKGMLWATLRYRSASWLLKDGLAAGNFDPPDIEPQTGVASKLTLNQLVRAKRLQQCYDFPTKSQGWLQLDTLISCE